MANVYLIRHGKSAAGFSEAINADLSELGKQQARDAAERINGFLKPIPIITSPFLRAKRSAEPLSQLWKVKIEIETDVTEIPCPIGDNQTDLPKRRPWLDQILTEHYGNQDAEIETWRKNLIQFISNLTMDCIIYTHYLTINAIVGFINQDNRVEVFKPGYCNITELDIDANNQKIIQLER